MKRILSTVSAVLLTAAAFAAVPDDVPAADSLSIGEVVVTGTRNRTDIRHLPMTVIFFFFDLFLLFFIGKADIQRGETERKIFHPMIHSPSERNGPILCRSEARSLFRVSHAGAGSQSLGPSSTAFLGHRQGAGWEVGPPGLELAPIWDPGRARRGP